MAAVTGSDSKVVPQGFKVVAHCAELQQAASVALTTPTVATVVTDADCWAAGDQQPAASAGGPTIGAVAGTITLSKAGLYRAIWGQSDITVVTTQVLTGQVFGGSAGTTALGGICKVTQLTGVGLPMAGSCLFTGAAGDIITLKMIASTGNYTSAAGFLVVTEL